MAELMAVALPLVLGQEALEEVGIIVIDGCEEAFEELLVLGQSCGDDSKLAPFDDGAWIEVGVDIAAEPGAVEDAVFAAEPAADEPAEGEQACSSEYGLKAFGILGAEGFGGLGKGSFIGGEFSDGFAGLLQFKQFFLLR